MDEIAEMEALTPAPSRSCQESVAADPAQMDPIALEIVWNGLKSIADECFLTIMRSAFSTNIKERHDHSIAILDRSGRLIVQAS